MLVSLIPADLAYAMEGEKLETVLLSDGQYLIKLPGIDYTSARQAPVKPDINPTDNPKDFSNRTVKVDINDMLVETLSVESVTVIVTCGAANYSKEYTLTKDKFGQEGGIKVPVPRAKHFPQIYVIFEDGRDSRYMVEAKSKPNNVVEIQIGFLGHTGVATKWFGSSEKPDVKGNYVGLNESDHIFDLPKEDQNSVLRNGDNPWSWHGHDNIVNLQVVPEEDIRANDYKTAGTMRFVINGKTQGQLSNSEYFFQVIGDSLHGFTATMREKNTVDFDAGDGTWKTAKPAQQFAANGLKLSEKFMNAPDTIGPVNVPNGESDLTPPAAEAGKPENVFKGWATTADGPVVDMDTFVVEGDTTFHAIYGPKDQGKIKVEYKDSKTNAAIDSKYQLKGQEYPAEKPGNKDEAIKDEVFDTDKAPKFLGYKIKSITTDPVPNPPATANYTENGDYTVIYTYDKLDDIIPEKKNGQDNPDVTPDVKEHYAKVTFQVAAADDAKAKLQLDDADATSPLVYYVNPLEGKTIADVANVKAVSKDDNLYKVDANDMWTYDPDSITGTNQVISQARDGQDNIVKTEITLTAKVADKTAAKFVDKLDPQDIKVWVGDTIDWKKGVKLKEANEDLQKILDKTETKVTDESNRNSDAANLPNGQKGDLKVTFEDGSSLEVKDQTLYVAPHKNNDNTNLPEDALKVDFKIGDGVTGTAKTEYVKPGTDVKEDAPTVTLKEGFKDAKWYKGDATTEATDDDYKVTANAEFTAKATGKDKVVKLDDPDNPTNFPKDPTDNNKKDADYVTVKFVADANGKIKENGAVKDKGIAYAVLKNTEWADAVTGGVVVPTEFEGKDKFYTFKEWQKDGTKVTTFPNVEATDLTFTAVFRKADEFSVTYNLNAPEDLTVGGTAPTDDTKYVKDEEVTVKALAADNKLAGYEFTGWNTKADGKGTTYAADAKFAIQADTELFAQWNKTAPDVIPVNNENDEKGKGGEEIPTNYVFVEFKVKDEDADKANIKANQQAKFKVDPKAKVTLTAPELEVKEAYKVSHTAKFNEADYTNKKFEQATTIWASVSEKGKIEVKYVFETNPKNKDLPDALMALKPENLEGNKKVYPENAPAEPTAPDTSSEEAQKALIEKDTKGKKLGEWKAGNWVKTTDKDGNITYTLTWTFKEVDKPAPQPEPTPEPKPVPEPEFNLDFKVHEYVPTFPVYAVVEKKEVKEVTPEIFTHEQYIFGYPDDTIRPDGDMTRAEAIAVVARLQKLDLSDKTSNIYKDTKAGMWYNAAINAAFREGYLLEKEGEDIRPNDKITRAELALLISHIDKKNNSVAPFEDVKGHKFEAAINQAYGNERIKGYPDGTFKPDNSITRAEVATMLNKLYDRNPDKNYIDSNQNLVHNFKDMSFKGHWGYYELVEAYHNHKFARLADKMEEWKAIIK